MTSITKLFKTLRNASSKGVKRHITNEIIAMYCTTPALVNALLEEVLFLSERTVWEDRLAGSRILEEMARVGIITEVFSANIYKLEVDIDSLLKKPKYLATYYTEKKSVKKGKDFIDLEDHNVVLSLSNINIPGSKAEDSLLIKKKQMQKPQKTEEKTEIESKEEFYQNVLKNLESFVWERRHGAALLLLGLFRGIHKRAPSMERQEELDPKKYLERMLEVLILDRFNDYEMDIAVSPVRETVAKALKEFVNFSGAAAIKETLELLTRLGKYEDWQIKYSGLLGLQYMEKVILPESHKKLITEIGATCVNLLNDLDEDVKRIAASILTSLLDRYMQEYGKQGAEVQSKINEVLEIEEIIERCWKALEDEEEDLASSKAKIMKLLEKATHQLGYGAGKVTKERWLSVLRLVRNSIDTVREAVLSLLNIIPVESAESLVGSLLFSILAEENEKIWEKTAWLLKEKASEVEAAQLQEIVEAFLSVACSVYTTAVTFPGKKMQVIVGESDICVSEDGCKSLGEERVLAGRAALLKILINSTEGIRKSVRQFFERSRKKSLPYFVFFKAVAGVLLAKIEGKAPEERKEEEAAEREKSDLSRAAYSMVRHMEGRATAEDAEILVYLYSVSVPVPLLKLLSEAIGTAPEKFTAFFKLAIESVCVREEAEAKEKKEEKKTAGAKKIKIAEDVEIEEKEWEIHTLFKVLDSVFLETEVFKELQKDMGKCGTFLQNTIKCFEYTERLQFIFKYAVENNMEQIVSYLVKAKKQNNEEFVKIVKKRLEEIVEDEGADHTDFLAFLESTVESSELYLLILMVFPLLRAMNTPFRVEGQREMASKVFSVAAPSMWMRKEGSAEDEEVQREIEIVRARVDSLMKPEDLGGIKMSVVLREYQKKGVEWMSFLRKSGLSGMLCDDMGLGKTIQVLALLAQQAETTENMSVLVLCPAALTGHWHMEITSHFPTLFSTTIAGFKGTGVCVASFDKFRVNYEKFTKYSWFYLVLDEGHVIRNANTLLHQRVKLVRAKNKLLLSGTPIQNSVGELWALFDILMPGFLGKEKEFSKEYIKPIEKARECKGTLRETEIAKEKLESLHKTVLPFILRRMKETVLSDLPPKVISDVYVELEPGQRKKYDEIATEGETSGEYGKVTTAAGNFSLLTRLIKVCSHVSLLEESKQAGDREKAGQASGKVLALLDLLKMMVQSSKILVFCQYKATIDMLIREVESAFPETRWVRLDGSVKGEDRSALAKKFNADPELSIMYLTTHAGGLGLNLTGADAVIFFEHDWNPMTDLQAMDRAHRIGQKKSVNVFRLISKNTIEESIMSLQRFKNYIASTVVSQQNVEIESMDTSNALERFYREKAPQEAADKEEEYHDFI